MGGGRWGVQGGGGGGYFHRSVVGDGLRASHEGLAWHEGQARGTGRGGQVNALRQTAVHLHHHRHQHLRAGRRGGVRVVGEHLSVDEPTELARLGVEDQQPVGLMLLRCQLLHHCMQLLRPPGAYNVSIQSLLCTSKESTKRMNRTRLEQQEQPRVSAGQTEGGGPGSHPHHIEDIVHPDKLLRHPRLEHFCAGDLGLPVRSRARTRDVSGRQGGSDWQLRV